MFSMLTLISPLVGQVMTILALVVLFWLAMPIFFSPHGIFAFQLNAFRAILNSLRMARFTLPTTALFLLVFVIISQGLSFLWNTPSRDSWWTLVGIGGHAFVSTALLAASFVYYRDANVWLQAVLEHLQKQNISARA
jgi:ABC-type proline/glycine betaine transport system permease subunit